MTKVKRLCAMQPKTVTAVITTILILNLFRSVQGVVTPLNPQLSYLPGVGTFINPGQNTGQLRVPRSQTTTVTSDTLDNPFLAPLESYQGDGTDSSLTPETAIEAFKPPAGDGKCSYVQMKGGPIPGAECQAGGMACTKDCSYDKGLSLGADTAVDQGPGVGEAEGNNCVTVMERMCGDVPKEECETVVEKRCDQVPEEVCDEEVEEEANDTDTK